MQPKVLQAEVVARDFTWPQAPRWWNDKLYVSDIHASRVVSLDEAGHVTPEFARPEESEPSFIPCGLLPTSDDMLVVSMAENVIRSTRHGGPVVALAGTGSTRPTDLVSSRTGHIFVTQIGFDIWSGAAWVESPLLRIRADGSAEAASEAGTFLVTSGLGFLPDGETLLVTEVGKGALHALKVGDDGRLLDRRLHAQLDVHGMCVDAEGGVWVAQTGTASCVRLAPDGKATTHEVALPAGATAVACALGGADGRTLFVTMGTESLDAAKSRAEKAGLIVAVAVDVPGLPVRVHDGVRP